ncbi:MAG: hypothetical protein D6704_12820 [Nitrospirae bacterium]|nr:MAG: hypothetical protein D6704_12820 [Nitrospirota bacterium]
MPFDERSRLKFYAGMRHRIGDLRVQARESWEFAIEYMMQDRLESFLHVEQGLVEIDHMLGLIEQELEHVHELAHAQRLEARLEFIEDRFDEFDSEIRQRPRRRRRKIPLFQFFRAAGGGGMNFPASQGEIQSAAQAYEVLGLEFGAPMPLVTRAFRQKAKKFHPDSRNGDRSAEPELRRIIEAYQFLKGTRHSPLDNS